MAPAPGDVRLRQDRWCCPILPTAMYTLLLTFKGGRRGAQCTTMQQRQRSTPTPAGELPAWTVAAAPERLPRRRERRRQRRREASAALCGCATRFNLGNAGMSQDLNVNTLEFGKSSLPFPLVVLKSRQYIVVHFKINH